MFGLSVAFALCTRSMIAFASFAADAPKAPEAAKPAAKAEAKKDAKAPAKAEAKKEEKKADAKPAK